MNCASGPPLVKNVPAVPSGPTKLKTPAALLLAAAWNRRVVLAGAVPFHDSVVQLGVKPTAGLASFAEETKSPDAAKPAFMELLKIRSLLLFCPIGFEQAEVVHVTRRPPGITSPELESHAWFPVVRFETSRITRPYCVPAFSVGGEL